MRVRLGLSGLVSLLMAGLVRVQVARKAVVVDCTGIYPVGEVGLFLIGHGTAVAYTSQSCNVLSTFS